MFRSTLARAAAAITFSFTAAVTVGTFIAPPAPPAAASPTVAYLDAASTAVRGLAAASHTTPAAAGCHAPAGVPGQWRSTRPDGAVYICDEYGAWVHVADLSGRRRLAAVPAWFHARVIPGACGRGDAGVMAYASGADQSVVVCKNGAVNPS